MNNKICLIVLLGTFILCSLNKVSANPLKDPVPEQPHRLIVLSDIEADPDDTQSFVRLLLYSNKIDIKGLIATTSCWKKTSVAPESIVKIIKAYGQIQPNLLKH